MRITHVFSLRDLRPASNFALGEKFEYFRKTRSIARIDTRVRSYAARISRSDNRRGPMSAGTSPRTSSVE